MARIKLTQGKYAVVDNEDLAFLSKWTWYFGKSPHGRNEGYARRNSILLDGSTCMVLMHRLIALPHGGEFTDHINGDGLDNRRANLRVCSGAQNRMNTELRADNTTQYKGVSLSRSALRWRSRITIKGKLTHLGYFNTKHEAAKAYNEAAKKYFGEFALLNEVKP